MLRSKLTGPDGAVFVLGLSDADIEKLKDDQPVIVRLTDLGGHDVIMLVHGKTELSIQLALAKHNSLTGQRSPGGRLK